MPRLYPRLDPMSANQLAEEHKGKTIEELSEFSSCEHSDAFVAPVGGTPVPQRELIELVGKVRTKLFGARISSGIRAVFEEAV